MESFSKTATVSQDAVDYGLRSKAPVFVLGCPRSGTTVLYHMLLSAGNFAVYRAESNVFSVLQPRFGSLKNKRNRDQLLDRWLRSELFLRTGLDADAIRKEIDANCRSAGDFLRIVMEAMARQQGVERWADCTPDHLLYIEQIKREIPNALVIHIIRDGRDVALSYAKQGWAYPLPWDRREQLSVAGLFWRWIVRRARIFGAALGSDYYELHYEDLVERPRETLAALGHFVGQELDHEQIQQAGIGSVSQPNSSFGSDTAAGFQPVGRWRKQMNEQQIADFESLTGDCLREVGYPLASQSSSSTLWALRLRATYRLWFSARHWLKSATPLGRLTRIGRMGLLDPEASAR